MTWLTGWTYQNAHTIKGSSAGIQTDYPVGIKVYYGPGVDGEEVIGGATFGKVYCDSKCKTDFGDIRFTKSDKVSLLDYWIEEQVDSDYAIIWVEVDSIPGNPGTVDIYIYYGNAGATTTSNGDDTFLIFNNCETTTGWSEQYIVGSPAWGTAIEDGFNTIYIEANAHNEKLRIQYDTITSTGRENRRALTRVKHTSWNADGYFNWYTPLALSPSTQYDALRYSSYFDYYTIYASVGGVSDTTNYNVAHPSGWYRYEKKTNAAGEVTAYRGATNLGTATVDGDYSGGKVMYYVNEWNSGLTKHYIDWFAIAKYVDPEPTHISWGGETGEGEEDLAAGFWVKGGEEDLLAGFRIRQDVADLFCRLQVMTHLDLPAKFDAIRSDSFAIPASFITGGRGNVPARLRVTRYYNLEGTGGIAFYWWGAANPVEAMNQLILESPTGFWYTDFYDGPAAWRLVEIPWGSFTWVSAPQRRLEPHRRWPYPPDQTTIGAFIWTVHTHGLRRLDYVYAYPRVLPTQLIGEFIIRRTAAVELAAGFMVRQVASPELKAGFIVPQGVFDLPAKFASLPEGMENFDTYSKLDVAGLITLNGARATWTNMRRDAQAYADKDFGANFFGDFEFDFICAITSVEAGDFTSTTLNVPFALSTHLDFFEAMGDNPGEAVLAIFTQENSSIDDVLRFIVWQREDGVTITSDIGAYRVIPDTYYCTIGRTGTNVYFKLYSDAERTVLLDDLSFVGTAVYKYRYIQIATSGHYSTDPADHSSGYIENLNIKKPSANLACGFDIT